MPTLEDVRAIALSFPETIEKVDGHRGGAGWRTPDGLFVWERGPSKADLAALARLDSTWPEGAVFVSCATMAPDAARGLASW